MTDLAKLVETYCNAWFDPSAERRRELLSASFERDGVYTDPKVHLVGIEALSNHIDGIVAARPGFWLERTTGIDDHHDFIRFGWVQRGADDFRGKDSVDFCQVSPEGKFSLVVGFFGPPRPME